MGMGEGAPSGRWRRDVVAAKPREASSDTIEYVLKAEQVKDALFLHKKMNLALNFYKEQLLNEYLRARGAHPMAAALANGSQAATLAIFF